LSVDCDFFAYFVALFPLLWYVQVKTLNKEIELLKGARESTGREFEQAETTQKELEKQLRQKDWELEDVRAMSHAR